MDGEITIGTRLDTKSFDKQIEALERDLEQMERSYETGIKLGRPEDVDDLRKLEVEIEKTKNKIVQLNQQKAKLGDTKPTETLGNSLQNAVKKAGRLALAVFGVRSAYMALRRASSDLANYDEQYATNLEYIRYVLTQAIAPVLRGIVNLAYQLLNVISAITQALFGVSIFSKKTVDGFQKMKAGASGTSKAVKEIKKQLAGFDEINVLQDQSDTGAGAGGGTGAGITMPDFGEYPSWLDKLGPVLAGIVASVIALKLGLKGIEALGIGIMVAGIIKLVQDLIDYLKDPTWEKFGKLLEDFGLIIVGLGILMGQWQIIVIGVVVAIVGAIIQNWDKIKEVLGKIWQFIYNVLVKPVVEMFTEMIEQLSSLFFEFVDIIKWIDDTIYNAVTKVWNGIVGFFSNIFTKIKGHLVAFGTKAGDVIGSAFKTVVNGVLSAIEKILNTPIKAINNLIGTINKVPGINITKLNTFSLPRLAVGGIVNMPNRGTMIGGAIAGERGAEGVIPLTDRQAMETLGEAIGRYITVNANIVNKMNGRTISRELIQVQNDQSFAYNG